MKCTLIATETFLSYAINSNKSCINKDTRLAEGAKCMVSVPLNIAALPLGYFPLSSTNPCI